jgi:cytochrome oxidase Cu insertion factor (SCO1/SenC/PrrC family)
MIMSGTMRLFSALLLSFGLALGAAQAQQSKFSPAERDAKAREYFTDTPLKTHTGRDVKFYSDALRGKVVLINFMFTGCGDACPLITAKLVQAKNDLGDAFGREVRFVSISIDPVHDRPEDLAQFARKFDAQHPEWLFLTGAQAGVETVVKKLGAYTENVENHSTGIIIGSPAQGRWKKVRPDAPAKVIAEELRHLVAGEIEVRKTASAPAAGTRQ